MKKETFSLIVFVLLSVNHAKAQLNFQICTDDVLTQSCSIVNDKLIVDEDGEVNHDVEICIDINFDVAKKEQRTITIGQEEGKKEVYTIEEITIPKKKKDTSDKSKVIYFKAVKPNDRLSCYFEYTYDDEGKKEDFNMWYKLVIFNSKTKVITTYPFEEYGTYGIEDEERENFQKFISILEANAEYTIDQ